MNPDTQNPDTYERLLARIIAVRKELFGLGFTIQGRLAAYEVLVRRLIAAFPDKLETEFTELEAGEMILTFAEITEFLYVSETLPTSPHLLQHPRFKEIFSGAPLQDSEAQKTTPRNTLFELTIASLYERANLRSEILAVSDVETVFRDTPICTECKRLQSFAGLEARISEAHHQLSSRLAERGKTAVGLVALSITKALTNGTKRLATQNPGQMHAAMGELLRMGQDNLAPFWNRYTEFDGVLVNLCVAGRTKGPFVNTQYALLARPDISEPRAQLLKCFLERLQNGRR